MSTSSASGRGRTPWSSSRMSPTAGLRAARSAGRREKAESAGVGVGAAIGHGERDHERNTGSSSEGIGRGGDGIARHATVGLGSEIGMKTGQGGTSRYQ